MKAIMKLKTSTKMLIAGLAITELLIVASIAVLYMASGVTERCDIPMTSTFVGDHVSYTNNILTVDGAEIPLWKGEQLFVNYSVYRDGTVAFIVKVDDKVVRKSCATREEWEKERGGL